VLKNKKGLTFIELLVVLAIMAVLATVSFVSIQYSVKQNQFKTYSGKCQAAMQLCTDNADLLNKGVGIYKGTVYFKLNENISLDQFCTKFQNMISSRMDPEYDIKIRTTHTMPTLSASKDTVIVYIDDLHSTNNYKLSHNLDLKVRGAWFIPKGKSTPVFTIDRYTEYRSGKNLTP
jgi:prepilin-type N-terminal cleavage/methylation domain-containing protein